MRRALQAGAIAATFLAGLLALFAGLDGWLAPRNPPALTSTSPPGAAAPAETAALPPAAPAGQSAPEPPQTTGAVAPPLGSVERDLRAVDEALARLAEGEAYIGSPKRMAAGEQATVTLSLGVNLPAEKLLAELARRSDVQRAAVRVSQVMTARLSGAGFEIEPSGMAMQAVSLAEPTTWRWTITAAQSGARSLKAELFAHIQLGGQPQHRLIRVLEQQIEIEASLLQSLAGFIGLAQGWHWLLATVVVPAGGWLWLRLRRLRRPPAQPAA